MIDLTIEMILLPLKLAVAIFIYLLLMGKVALIGIAFMIL